MIWYLTCASRHVTTHELLGIRLNLSGLAHIGRDVPWQQVPQLLPQVHQGDIPVVKSLPSKQLKVHAVAKETSITLIFEVLLVDGFHASCCAKWDEYYSIAVYNVARHDWNDWNPEYFSKRSGMMQKANLRGDMWQIFPEQSQGACDKKSLRPRLFSCI